MTLASPPNVTRDTTHVARRDGYMYTRAKAWIVLGMAAIALVVTPRAHAQEAIPETGGRVFGLVGGTFGDSGAALATSGGAGLRLTRHLGLDVELTYLSGGEGSDDDLFIQPLQWPRLLSSFDLDREQSVTAFLTKFTVDFPVANGRLFPYITGGGGIAHVKERTTFDVDIDGPRLEALERLRPRGRGVDGVRFEALIFPPVDFEQSETGLSLTIGGGLDVRIWRGLGIGVEARWLRVLRNQEDLDVAQLTSRVSYRF